MRRKVAVAKLEPGRSAECLERRHKGPGLVAPAPSGRRVIDTGQCVEKRVYIGRNREPEMLEIIPCVGDDGQRTRRQGTVKAERQLSAADPTRQSEHAHRKRSCSAGRISAAAATSGADQRSPRISTIGTASSAWPIT